MRDRFFTVERCDRCHVRLTARIMSMYNDDVLCPECQEKEAQRSDYQDAVQADRDAIKRGDYNFPGIGWKAQH